MIMKWSNLKLNKCPQCDKDLIGGSKTYPSADGFQKIIEHKCGFKISERKYAQIVSSQINKDLEDKLNKEFEE